MAFSESFIAANMNKFPAEQLPNIKSRLENLNESQSNIVLTTKIKDPQTALILSIFLGAFGVDRFYIGHTGLGIAKLCLGWLTLGLWTVIDWFLIYKATKQSNLEAINAAIASATV